MTDQQIIEIATWLSAIRESVQKDNKEEALHRINFFSNKLHGIDTPYEYTKQ